MRRITRIRRSIKAISPVISVLLMIAIAVAAALVAYAWVMGYLDFTTTKVGKAIQIQSISTTAVYVQNVGDSDVTLTDLYVNDILDVGATFSPEELGASETSTVTSAVDWSEDKRVTIKIVTTDGTSAEYTETFSNPPGGGGPANLAPSAAFTFLPANPEAGETLTFTDASTDSDGTVDSWSWDFDDGGTSTLQNPTHVFVSGGTYTVGLTVTDNNGAIDYFEDDVVVINPTLFYDDFTDGIDPAWDDSGYPSTSSSNPAPGPSGGNYAVLNNDEWIRIEIDTTSYGSIRLSYWRRGNSLSSGAVSYTHLRAHET